MTENEEKELMKLLRLVNPNNLTGSLTTSFHKNAQKTRRIHNMTGGQIAKKLLEAGWIERTGYGSIRYLKSQSEILHKELIERIKRQIERENKRKKCLS